MARQGRPPRSDNGEAGYVRDESGKEVHGLSKVAHKRDAKGNVIAWRYFTWEKVDGKRKQIWFGTDEKLAIARFRQRFEALPPGVACKVTVSGLLGPQFGDVFGQSQSFYLAANEDGAAPAKVLNVAARRREIAPFVREWLIEDLADAARQIGIPELANLHNLRPPEPSLTLEEIGKMYFDREGKKLHPRWQRDCRRYWDEFCDKTGCRTVADLCAEAVKQYRDAIYQGRLAGPEPKKPRYVNNRFDAVRIVMRYVPKEAGGRDVDNVTRAISLLEMLRRLDSDEENPNPISPEHFEKLYNPSDVKWKAILLTSLNCAFYLIDVAQLEKVHIDLEKRWLMNFRTKTRRGKKKSHRIAVLWDRTVQAIESYWKEEPHDQKTVFVSHLGTPYSVKSLQNYFRESIREPSGLTDKQAAFNTIRDGAASAAGNDPAVDPVHVDMLLGHRTGEKDRYWFRKPWVVADACAAIERHYFPAKDEASGNGQSSPGTDGCTDASRK